MLFVRDIRLGLERSNIMNTISYHSSSFGSVREDMSCDVIITEDTIPKCFVRELSLGRIEFCFQNSNNSGKRCLVTKELLHVTIILNFHVLSGQILTVRHFPIRTQFTLLKLFVVQELL